MEEEIDASPTSQKKRKKASKCRVSQKVFTTDEENKSKFMKRDQNIGSVRQPTQADSHFPMGRKIWQSAYLLEEADKVQPAPKKRNANRCIGHEFRLSGPAEFLSVTQLCASQSSAHEVKDSQWEVTESQFQKLDDVIKDSYQRDTKNGDAGLITSPVQIMESMQELSNGSVEHIFVPEESANISGNSLKRRSSVLQSILSEWPSTSPVKNKKTKREMLPPSPHFVFNRKRVKKTYRRARQNPSEIRKLLPQLRKSSVCSEIAAHSDDDTRADDYKQPKVPTDVNVEEDEDFDESMNIVDNIYNLSKFFSQPAETPSIGNDVDSPQYDSMDDEEDFHGFDGEESSGGLVSITLPEYFLKCDKKLSPLASVTLYERFYDFDTYSNPDDSVIHSSADAIEEDLFMDDDDIFANFKTQNLMLNGEINTDECVPSTSASAAALKDEPNHKTNRCEMNFHGNHAKPDARKTSTKAANIFDDIEQEFNCVPILQERSSNEPSTSTSNPNFPGFASVSSFARPNHFNTRKISEDEHRPTNTFPGEIDSRFESLLQRPRSELVPNAEFTGFTTVTGKPISMSLAFTAKKNDIFRDVTVSGVELKDMDNWISDTVQPNIAGDSSRRNNSDVKFTGFTTARGSRIDVSSELISKKVNIFDSVNVADEEVKEMDNWISEDQRMADLKIHAQSNPSLTGFSTARGKPIPMSSAMQSKKREIFRDVEVTNDDLTNMNSWIGDNNQIGERNVNDSIGMEQSDLNSNTTGFTSARGKLMPMSSKKVNIFDNIKMPAGELQRMNNWIDDTPSSATPTEGKRKIPMSSPIVSSPLVHNVNNEQRKQSNSGDLFREVTNLAQKDTEPAPKKFAVNTTVGPSPMRKMSLRNSLRNVEILKENVVATANSSVDGNGTTSSSTTPMSVRPYVCITPTRDAKTYSQIGRECAAALMEDEQSTFIYADGQSTETTPGFVTGFMAELSASSTPISRGDNCRNRPKQRRLAETFDDIAGEENLESEIPLETIKIKVSSNVKLMRKAALAEQQKNVKRKQSSSVKAVPSTLYVKKLTSTKVNWKEFVDQSRPTNKLQTNTKLANNVLHVTVENAAKFKFNAWDHYSDAFCVENIDGIYLPDDIVVVMDENCQIGLTEISSAFLACPSVDPKLVHHKWIENCMKWIVVKLAGMERSFPHRFAGQALTLENLMLQMKYRYEREIDRAERTAIRRICEMDDISERRMILFVAGITTSCGSCEVELSDGWYSLMSTFVYGMERLVRTGKIKIGTKLVIQGANTVNLSSGCHPLDVSSNVKLKVHANSTRRARWDAVLGYCKNPQALKISLRSVLGDGGSIGKLRVCVLRVYPVVYVDQKNCAYVHSERVEKRRRIKEERENAVIYDKVVNQVSREYEDEEKAARFEHRPKKIAKVVDVSSITDPADLCQLLDEGNDPERIESELTNTQKRLVFDFKDKMNCIRSEEIRARVQEKLASIHKDQPKYVPLFKFKIIDETSYDKTAVVTIWKPPEEILSTIKEEHVFDMIGTQSRGVRFGELQIYAGKDAMFQKVNLTSQVPTTLRRRYISISELHALPQVALNELDTVGVVVHVGETVGKFQPVYIADSGRNVVCISFFESIKFFAYEDVVQLKRILAVRNLIWLKSSRAVPCTKANEYSTFTEHPQSSELTSAITSLRAQMANVDLDEFIEKCMEETVRSDQSKDQSTPIRPNSTSLLQSSASSLPMTPANNNSPLPGRSSLTNQSRIELLGKYGDPKMSTPPMNINVTCVNKSFKLPVPLP